MRFIRKHALSCVAVGGYLVFSIGSGLIGGFRDPLWWRDRLGEAGAAFMAAGLVAHINKFPEDGSPEGLGKGPDPSKT